MHSAYSKSLSVRSNQKQDFQSGCKKWLERRKLVIRERGFDSNPSVLTVINKKIDRDRSFFMTNGKGVMAVRAISEHSSTHRTPYNRRLILKYRHRLDLARLGESAITHSSH